MLTGSSSETGIIHLTLQAVTASGYVTSKEAEEAAPEPLRMGPLVVGTLHAFCQYAKTVK